MSFFQLFHEQVGLLIKKDIWNIDLPSIKIDDQCRDTVIEHAHRIRGSVRLRRGLIYTDSEAQQYKEEAEKTKLP